MEQRVQAVLIEEASAALAKRLRTVPVRARPIRRRARRTCWPWVSEERRERKGGRAAEGMHLVRGAEVAWGRGGLPGGGAIRGAWVATHSAWVCHARSVAMTGLVRREAACRDHCTAAWSEGG